MTDGIDEFDDQALQVLDDYLLSDRAPENGLGLSDLDGFLTALIVGPELVQPGEWLPVVWGGEEPQFENLDEANAVISAIFSRNNQIIRELEEGDLGPLFWERPGGVVIAADWCEGFMDGVRAPPRLVAAPVPGRGRVEADLPDPGAVLGREW